PWQRGGRALLLLRPLRKRGRARRDARSRRHGRRERLAARAWNRFRLARRERVGLRHRLGRRRPRRSGIWPRRGWHLVLRGGGHETTSSSIRVRLTRIGRL